MGSTSRSLLVAVLVGAGLLAPVGTASAQCTTCGVDDVLDRDTERLIPLGWPTFGEAKNCAETKRSCPHLGGLAYAHVDISDEMEGYTEAAYFDVSNALVSTTTQWLVCSYGAADPDPIDCWFDDEPSWGLQGELGEDARELRLLPVGSAPNEYALSLYVS